MPERDPPEKRKIDVQESAIEKSDAEESVVEKLALDEANKDQKEENRLMSELGFIHVVIVKSMRPAAESRVNGKFTSGRSRIQPGLVRS